MKQVVVVVAETKQDQTKKMSAEDRVIEFVSTQYNEAQKLPTNTVAPVMTQPQPVATQAAAGFCAAPFYGM